MKLSETGVKRPITTIMFFLSILIVGMVSYSFLAVDMMPEIESPSISVITGWDGASAEDVESKITRIIENSLGGVTDLDEISSTTSEGSSRVSCKFKWGTDLGEAANDMRDLLERAKWRLPDDADDPIMYKFNTANMPVMFYGISSKENTAKMVDTVNDELVDVLKRVPGVGSAEAFGGRKRQINVHINPNKLAAYNLSLAEVEMAIENENITEPAGNIKIGTLDYTIRVPGEFDDPEQVANVIVKREGNALVRVSDIAYVQDGFVEDSEVNEFNGQRGMVMRVMKRSGENTVAVCKNIREEMEELKQKLPADYTIYQIMDSSETIEKSIKSVGQTIMYGGIFVILVTLIFLRSLRASLVIALTIPFSLIIAFIFMFLMDWTINIMSMSALAIAIGMVVDNAVVVLENIISHISRGNKRKEAAMFGADEVGQAAIASTLTTVVVFLPLIFVEGVTGIMMKQLGGIVSATLFASVICALYLTPMLASKILKEPNLNDENDGLNKFQRWSEGILQKLEIAYSHFLSKAIKARWIVVILAAGVIAGTVYLFSLLGSEFMAEEDSASLQIKYELPLSTRYELTADTGRRILEVVKDVVGIENLREISLSAGGGGGWSGGASHIGEVRCKLVDQEFRDKHPKQYGAEITKIVSQWPEVTKAFAMSGSFMNRMLMGGDSNLRIDIFGHDLNIGTGIAKEVVDIARSTKGTSNIRISQDMGKPELSIQVDRSKAASAGLSVYEVTAAIGTLFQGTTASEFREGEDSYDIELRLDIEYRQTLEDIRRSEIRTPSGEMIRIDSIANVVETTGPVSISRLNQERRISIFLDAIDRPEGDVMNDIETRIKKEILLPSGTSIEYGGMIEEQADSERAMAMMIILGVVLVYMVMAAQFESFIHPLIIMFSVPFAFSGVAAILYLTNTPLSMTAYIGIILLIGVVVNNAIVLIDYINLLRTRGQKLRDAIVNSGQQRLRPVLITTCTTMLGMLPMALSSGSGSETWRPLGLVVCGGLCVSSLVTLIIIPTIYYIIESHRKAAKKELAA